MARNATQSSDDESKPHYHSHALSRGLETIRVVATTPGPSTLNHLHEVTGYPKSTLVRLLSVLEEEDYLIKVDERPAYRLGHGLLPIAAGYFETVSVADLLRPHLSALAKATGWTANFGVLDGRDVVHLCVEFPDRPIYYTTTEGSANPAYCTGLGKAILSQLDDETAASALPPDPFERLTPYTITTRAEMSADLRRIRERGYAIDAEEADLGLRCLAVTIDGEGGPLGALSVSGPSGEASADREADFVAALMATRDEILSIRELSSALGMSRGSAA